MPLRRWLPPLLLLAAAALLAAFAGDLGTTAFDMARAHHVQWRDWTGHRPLLAPLLFFVSCVLLTALSIPLATVLALLAGSLFPLPLALAVISLGCTTGATLAMLLTRHLLRPQVLQRWPGAVTRLNRGLHRDGGLYLFMLRLAPAPPFFVVNMLCGLTELPLRTFFVASLLGMLPFDLLFVSAGRMLARITSPADVLQPGMILLLMLMGMLPLLARTALRRWRRRHDRAQ